MPLPVTEEERQTLRTYLIRDKLFLKALYECDNNLTKQQILESANETNLCTLIKYLHFYAIGDFYLGAQNSIPILMKFSCLDEYLCKTLGSERKTSVLLSSSKETKLKFLLKLKKIYCYLLHPLMNRSVRHDYYCG